MSSNYDSILKEEKVYTEEVREGSPLIKYLVIYGCCLMLILGISYGIYYKTILKATNVFLNDFKVLIEKYSKVVEPLKVSRYGEDFMMEGSIALDASSYQYELLRRGDDWNFRLSSLENNLSYYQTSLGSFLEVSSLEDKSVNVDDLKILNLMQNLGELEKNVLENIALDRYIKQFYVEDKGPIVEVNVTFTSDDLMKIFSGLKLTDQYSVMVTLKNQAVSNEIVGMKVVLNNQTQGKRMVVTYQDEVLEYTTDEGKSVKFVLQNEEADMTLKIYQGEELYSVLSGSSKKTSYQYTYQIIDQVYNLGLNIKEEEGKEEYELTSNIEVDGEIESATLVVSGLYSEGNTNWRGSSLKQVEESLLTEEEQNRYVSVIDSLVKPLEEVLVKNK